jgi:hypothetical protein
MGRPRGVGEPVKGAAHCACRGPLGRGTVKLPYTSTSSADQSPSGRVEIISGVREYTLM